MRPNGPIVAIVGALLLHTLARFDASAGAATPPAEVCARVKGSEAVRFLGRELLETPDIEAPELRRANALVSARCFDEAGAALEAHVALHPDDDRASFVSARMAWIFGQRMRAEGLAVGALQRRPDFTSMKVLIASMRIDDGEYGEAERLLGEVVAAQPKDLRAYLGRLRIEAARAPSPELGEMLRRIAKDPAFPPAARLQAEYTAGRLPSSGWAESDAIFESAMQDPVLADDCRLARQAENLMELRNDPAAAAALLERYVGRNPTCYATPRVRTLLAEAHLLQAAAIAPRPSPDSQSHYDRARAALGDDFTLLAQRLAWRPQLAHVLPYVGGRFDPGARDAQGNTVLCAAVHALNVAMVAHALAHGGDAAAQCGRESPVSLVVLMATSSRVAERQAVLRALLEHGAPAERMEYCASPSNGDCRTVLLPILQEYAGRAASVRT